MSGAELFSLLTQVNFKHFTRRGTRIMFALAHTGEHSMSLQSSYKNTSSSERLCTFDHTCVMRSLEALDGTILPVFKALLVDLGTAVEVLAVRDISVWLTSPQASEQELELLDGVVIAAVLKQDHSGLLYVQKSNWNGHFGGIAMDRHAIEAKFFLQNPFLFKSELTVYKERSNFLENEINRLKKELSQSLMRACNPSNVSYHSNQLPEYPPQFLMPSPGYQYPNQYSSMDPSLHYAQFPMPAEGYPSQNQPMHYMPPNPYQGPESSYPPQPFPNGFY